MRENRPAAKGDRGGKGGKGQGGYAHGGRMPQGVSQGVSVGVPCRGHQEVEGLADLLASINLAQHLPNANAWCVLQGADHVDDLRVDYEFAGQLAEALKLPPIKAKKLVDAINVKETSQEARRRDQYEIEEVN